MSSFPWKEIFDYLSETGRERDVEEFCYKGMIGLEKLVHADGSVLQMVGSGRTLLPTSRTHNLSEKALQQYRAYFYKIDPGRAVYPEGVSVIAAKWSDMPAEKEFIDFLREHKILASGGVFLYDYQDDMFAFLNVHTGSEQGFTRQAVDIMHAVQPHLNNLLANLTMPSPLKPEIITPTETQEEHTSLSRREAEITGYLCRRFSAHQIAETLRISSRTVERHVEHIYEKLGIHKKQDLMKLLMTTPKQKFQVSG